MRYELTDHEWAAIKPMLPKPRGVPRVNDRRVLTASFGSCDPARHGAIYRRRHPHRGATIHAGGRPDTPGARRNGKARQEQIVNRSYKPECSVCVNWMEKPCSFRRTK